MPSQMKPRNIIKVLLVISSIHGASLVKPPTADATTSSSASVHGSSTNREQLMTWLDHAIQMLANLSCNEDPSFLGGSLQLQCEMVVNSIPRSQMNVYLAAPVPRRGRLIAVLPEGPMHGKHDAVLALDPFPNANFGHIILVFFVNFGLTERECHQIHDGIIVGNGECLSFGLNNRCYHLSRLERKLHRNSFISRCEINFLPLVHLANEEPQHSRQRLHCVRNVPGFAACPELRSLEATGSLVCDPLQVNNQRCGSMFHRAETMLRSHGCKLFQTCDHAVILSGGWNRQTSPTKHEANMEAMYKMLKNNGFHKRNVKIFFANGNLQLNVAGDNHTAYPSAFKLAFRYHLQKLCQTPHCVDSLVLYLNSPTRKDGSSMLWDADGNGQVDNSEMYTVRELLHDIQDCSAKQVYIIADQNFGGEIVRALSHSKRHTNVLAFTSTTEHQYSWNEYTKHWVNTKQFHKCMSQVHQGSKLSVRHSEPAMYDSSEGRIQTTLSGAPCNVRPPFNHKELETRYFGCQNLPTSIWMGDLLKTWDADR